MNGATDDVLVAGLLAKTHKGRAVAAIGRLKEQERYLAKSPLAENREEGASLREAIKELER